MNIGKLFEWLKTGEFIQFLVEHLTSALAITLAFTLFCARKRLAAWLAKPHPFRIDVMLWIPAVAAALVATAYFGISAPVPQITSEPLFSPLYRVIATILVFVMQLGFVAFEAGEVHRNSRTKCVAKNAYVFAFSVVTYVLIGPLIQGLMGNSLLAHQGYMDLAFHAGFASTASMVVANALAERTTVQLNVLLACVTAGVGYPVLSGLMWASGPLARWGFVDWAGACVVHMLGGLIGLFSALLVGPGFWTQAWRFLDKPQRPDQRSLMPLTILGGLVLWLGWLGFNCGNALNQSDFERTFLTTSMGACGGAFASIALFIFVCLPKSVQDGDRMTPAVREMGSLERIIIGMMGGLVCVTANANYLTLGLALGEGFLGGLVAVVATSLISVYASRLDDGLGAIATHAGAGFVGIILTPFLLPGTWGEKVDRLIVQLQGCGVCALVACLLAVSTCLLFRCCERISIGRLTTYFLRLFRLRPTWHHQATGKEGDSEAFGPPLPVRWDEESVNEAFGLTTSSRQWDLELVSKILIAEGRAVSPEVYEEILRVISLDGPYDKRAQVAVVGSVLVVRGTQILPRLLDQAYSLREKPSVSQSEHEYLQVLVWAISYFAEGLACSGEVLRKRRAQLTNQIQVFQQAKDLLKAVWEDPESPPQLYDMARIGLVDLSASILNCKRYSGTKMVERPASWVRFAWAGSTSFADVGADI